MELPLFALHTVLFPRGSLSLRVFEERYLRMMDDVLPEGPIAIAAIREGQEVGGTYEPYRVGVRVTIDAFTLAEDGTIEIDVRALDRLRLLEPVEDRPYARWRVAPFPEEGQADRELVSGAAAAALGFLRAAGLRAEVGVGTDPVAASYALAALTPVLLPERQALLEIAGPGERLDRLSRVFRREASLLRALRQRRAP
jgi:Lon protease-like protein